MVNFDVANCSNFQDNGGGGAGGINGICGRLKVADDVIPSYNVETFPDSHVANL